jgi:Concanavalin A-like lectin/glucanases superfamily
MSASLIILIPVILFGIVGMFCFVGCTLPTGGLGPDFNTYTTMILSNKDIIAYWPLKEGADTMPASELVSNNAGKYIDQTTAMPDTVYPWPGYSVQNGANPDVLSAAAGGMDNMGDIKLAQPRIVTGDVIVPLSSPLPPACMVVNGCYVEVPWNDKFIPKTSFTVEAWVRVDWTDGDPHAWRFVLDMRERTPVTTGFAIFAKADDNADTYRWAALVGDGSPTFVPIENTETITLKASNAPEGTTFYLALTFENQTLTLFVNGVQKGTFNSGYMPNAAQVLWIGAGTPYSPRRTHPPGQPPGPDPASPLFPFVGAIQDVAIYKAALPPLTILGHFNNGQGNNGEGNP